MQSALLLWLTLGGDAAPVVVPLDGGAVLIREGGSAPLPTSSSGGTTLSGPAPVSEAAHIDIDVVNADIRDVLRLVAIVSGLNFVVDDAVKGTVTARMLDVPWDMALAAILQSKGLTTVPFGESILLVQPGG